MSAKEPELLQSNRAETLPDELVWAAGGHVSDVVLTAIADGQHAIVPNVALAHVAICTTCTTHLGNAALLSLHAGEEIALVNVLPARSPLPRLAIGIGLLVAFVGSLPSLLDFGHSVDVVRHDVPLFSSGLRTLFQRFLGSESGPNIVVTYATALVLVGMGFAVVRLLPKKEVSR